MAQGQQARDPVAALAEADQRRRDRREAVEDAGREALRTLADAHDDLRALLDRYEEDATGTGEFETYLQFQGELVDLVEALPEDLPERDAFETVSETLHRRTLREKHFRQAREALAPVADRRERLDEWESARERYREARSDLAARREELGDRIADLERVVSFADADLAADLAPLREPIERYDRAVREAFRERLHARPARETVARLADAAHFPLVDFQPPPEDLRSYLATADVGTEPVRTLLEYADYSASKREHYVADSEAFRRHVAANRAYFTRLDPEPLTVGWPPPPADRLRWTVRELGAMAGRLAADARSELHAVRRLPTTVDYERLRQAALARSELTEDERKRLGSGAAQADLADAREERARIEDALEEYPPLDST